jgi:hypothetical protein
MLIHSNLIISRGLEQSLYFQQTRRKHERGVRECSLVSDHPISQVWS